MRDAGKFTLSQFRLVCGPRTRRQVRWPARARPSIPLGYIGANNRLETKSLGEIIAVDPAKVPDTGLTIDLAFHVPTNLTPVLIEFKRNNVARVSSPAASEDAPQPVPFSGLRVAIPDRPAARRVRPNSLRTPTANNPPAARSGDAGSATSVAASRATSTKRIDGRKACLTGEKARAACELGAHPEGDPHPGTVTGPREEAGDETCAFVTRRRPLPPDSIP